MSAIKVIYKTDSISLHLKILKTFNGIPFPVVNNPGSGWPCKAFHNLDLVLFIFKTMTSTACTTELVFWLYPFDYVKI